MPTSPDVVINADDLATLHGVASTGTFSTMTVGSGSLNQATAGSRPFYYGPAHDRAIGGNGVISGEDGTRFIKGTVPEIDDILNSTTYTISALVRARESAGNGLNALFSKGNAGGGLTVLCQKISDELGEMCPTIWGGTFLTPIHRFFPENVGVLTITADGTATTPYVATFVNGLKGGVDYNAPRNLNGGDPFALFTMSDNDNYCGTWDIAELRFYSYALSISDPEAITQAEELAGKAGYSLRTYNTGFMFLQWGDSWEFGYHSDPTDGYFDAGLGTTGNYTGVGERNGWGQRAFQRVVDRDGKAYWRVNLGRPGRNIDDMLTSLSRSVVPFLNHLGTDFVKRVVIYGEMFNSANTGGGLNTRYNPGVDTINAALQTLLHPPTLFLLRDGPYRAAYGTINSAIAAIIDTFNDNFNSTDYAADNPAGMQTIKLAMMPVRDALFVEDNNILGTDVHPQESQQQRISDGFEGFEGVGDILLAHVPSEASIPEKPVLSETPTLVNGGVRVSFTSENATSIVLSINGEETEELDPDDDFPYTISHLDASDPLVVKAKGISDAGESSWSDIFYLGGNSGSNSTAPNSGPGSPYGVGSSGIGT